MTIIDDAYLQIVAQWRQRHIANRSDLTQALQEYRIRYAYHSGKIENEAITYHDTRSVFEDGRVVGFTGDVRTLFEMQNLKSCHELLLDAYAAHRPLDRSLVFDFHRTLTQGTYDDRRWSQGERPGTFKKGDYVVGAADSGLPANQVPQAIDDLLQEIAVANEENILTVAAYFHVAFEAIHPFADGNGRCGRELMNYLFLLHDHPPVIIFDEDKVAYYGAMEAWDVDRTLDPMRDFLMVEAIKTWHR